MRYPAILVLAGILLCTACGEESNDSSSGADTQKVEVSKGEQIFRSSCMACHGLDEARIGPALKGTFASWNYDTARITAFIRNAGETIKAGDPRAVKVAEEWNNALMTPMPHLTDNDIKAILEYIAE